MKKLSLMCLGVCLLIPVTGCSRNQSVTAYTRHIDAVTEMVVRHRQNTDLAAVEVAAYVEANRGEIEAALNELGEFDDGQIETFYGTVMQPVRKLRRELAGEVISYPDSVVQQILSIFEEEKETIAGRVEAYAGSGSATVIQQNFARFSVELALIKEMVRRAPLRNFHLRGNREFMAAMNILRLDNLVLEE